ncbi:MAG: hypothetical protein JXJ22_13445 [Bacteroidales bacterium]|nr:hypothetical protein [Bacteroidales bacterium]
MNCTGCTSCQSRGITDIYPEKVKKINYKKGYTKLSTSNWLDDFPINGSEGDIVEVQFKNTRKGFYINNKKIRLKQGDLVCVEAAHGHDTGTISLTGDLVYKRLKKRISEFNPEIASTVYRKARQSDIEKWQAAMEKDQPTLITGRKIIHKFGLDMKLSDVEYQGDGIKAVFYYIAEGRVDFRELIKKFADAFKVRIEMRQIGVRQEAGRIGGIGSCGRELCCSSWRTELNSVPLSSVQIQDLPSNAQKLAGQCGKLKCCLTYELDNYIEAKKEFPKILLQLETKKGIAYHHKTDALRKLIWYSFDPNEPINLVSVPVERVKEIIALNKKGIKADSLVEENVSINQ